MKTADRARDIWYNLDNAANIFPAISDERNTNVFRLSCTVRETIDKEALQRAVDTAMQSFGHFQVVMRRGLFWFYLERTPLSPVVAFESLRPMHRLFYKNRKELLFSVSYYRRRINLEVFHSVSDGTGAMQLLRAIVYHYVILRQGERLPHPLPPLEGQSAPVARAEDSFSRHYDPGRTRSPFQERAYQIGGALLPGGGLRIHTGSMPVKQVLALAKENGATLTGYLSALLICGIYTELMPARARHKPIGITVPVDLRNHFPSETARNFFSVVDVVYRFDGAPADFEAVLRSVSDQLRKKLEIDELAGRMNFTTGVQHNIFARAAPLALKNIVLRAAYHRGERATTCALSNVGRITMPDAIAEHIDSFTCLLNPTPIHRLKLCLCSFGDRLDLSFTACIADTRVQKYVFRHLAARGVDITITCNGVNDNEIL